MTKKSGVYVGSDPVPARIQIDAIIENTHDWRGKKLDLLRSIIMKTNRNVIEEVKWKKPSRPEGVPVWSLNGIICVADLLKEKVRLTFPQGAKIQSHGKLFNTRLHSRTVRAVDFYTDDIVDETCLFEVVSEAIDINSEKIKHKIAREK